MTVLRWPKHTLVSPEEYPDLGGCSVCGGWEGEVPKDCPGEPMTQDQKDLVMAGKLDFIWREGWTTVTYRERLRVKMKLEPVS